MNDAERAFQTAERMIEEALATGATHLDFNREETWALEALPDTVSDLHTLEQLSIAGTQIKSLAPLSGLDELRAVWLSGTRVHDLIPLRGKANLKHLAVDGTDVVDFSPLVGNTSLRRGPVLYGDEVSRHERTLIDLASGLIFQECAAAREDPRIGEIAGIEDPTERFETLFEYLDTRDADRARKSTPEADPILRVVDEGERLEVAASVPSEAERDERLKQVLHQQLRDRAAALARQAGNRFSRLAARARLLEEQVERDFADLDLLMLHLATEDLRDLETLGREDEDGDAFPPEVVIALGDVLRLGPGLTLGHADVDVLVERANRRRSSAPVPDAELAAQDDMSDALIAGQEAIGDRLRTLEETVARSSTAEDREAQKAVHRNVLWRIAVGAGGVAGTVAVGVVTGVLTTPVETWVVANVPALLPAAATYGPAFYDWFALSLGQMTQLRGTLDVIIARFRPA